MINTTLNSNSYMGYGREERIAGGEGEGGGGVLPNIAQWIGPEPLLFLDK